MNNYPCDPFLNRHKKVFIILLVGLFALLPALTILDAQFREDEALTLRTTLNLAESFQKGYNLPRLCKDLIIKLTRSHHPPARSIIPLPFVLVLGGNERSLRLPNVLLWVAACMVAANIGWRLASDWGAFLSGTILGISGLFDLEAMGLGHAGEVLWIMLVIDCLLSSPDRSLQTPLSRKKYLLGGMYCFLGFLWFTSVLPICVLYHGLYGYNILRNQKARRDLKVYLIWTSPFISGYLLYYGLFLGWPAYLVYRGQYTKPFGQLAQNFYRANTSHPNIRSLIQNARALNWYVFPFFSWILLVAGMFYQVRHFPLIFILLLGYGGLWSFYLSGNTPQHFFAYYCWLLPFAVAACEKLGDWWNKKIVRLVLLMFVGLTAAWNYQTHIRRYTETTYPRHLVSLAWGWPLWPNNIDRPMQEMVQDLQILLQPDEQFIVLSDGAFPLYYFKGEGYLPEVGMTQLESFTERGMMCLRLPDILRRENYIRAAVSFTNQNFCQQEVESLLSYQGSTLQITIFEKE
jgi:4-amino-4-deoxy-L-arabinose transferase-like glycosyltransferase